MLTPEQNFEKLTGTFLGNPDVSLGSGKKGFGFSALQIHNRIFAMLTKGRLVIKLPRPRVDALVAAGEGERFDPGHGRLLKEWLALHPASAQDWAALAKEAMDFVGSKGWAARIL